MGLSIAVQFLIWIGTTFLTYLLRPKLNAKPGEITFPTASEGRPIPIVYGTCEVESPNILWYGDLRQDPRREGGFLGTPIGEQTIGYYYYLGIQYGVCTGPIDDILEVRFDKRSAEFGETDFGTYRRLSFDLPSFFGGDGPGGDGGLAGQMDIYLGGPLQEPNDYLEDKRGTDLPAYRNLSYAVCRQMYFGTSPILKPVSFVVKRVPNGLGLTGGKHDVGGDANPACMIYDLLTTPHYRGGLGISEGLLDVAGMRAAGDTLFAEGLGLSMVLDTSASGWDVLRDIMTHVDAVLFSDPSTGLLTLKLIRFDYDPDDLLVLDPSNCRLTGFTRPTWDEVRTDVTVSYRDRADGFRLRQVQFHELAVFEVRSGQASPEEVELLGISTATNAQKAAARAGVALCYPWASLSLEVNRLAWSLRPGSVARLNWPPLGISGMVIRIARIQSGTLVDGRMPLEAVEDLFAVSWTAYTPPPPSGWVDPAAFLGQLTDVAAIHAPYESVKSANPPSDILARALVMAAHGEGITLGYYLYVRRTDGSWPPGVPVATLTPSGLLASVVTKNAVSIQVDDGPDSGVLADVSDADFAAGKNLLWIDDEFIAFKTVTRIAGGFTLNNCVRGCIDTVPQDHAAGARVWFVSYGAGIANLNTPAYPEIEKVNYLRFQAFNSWTKIDFALAPERILSVSPPFRATRPYAPTDVRFNGSSFPASITGELTVSWAHRNRLAAWSYADAGITAAAEAGTSYTIKVYGELGALVHTEAGLTGTAWTYLEATEIAESGLGRLNNHLGVQVLSVRGGDASWRMFEWEFDRV